MPRLLRQVDLRTKQSNNLRMVQGRPLQFDPDRALERAMHCFWQQGYESTSLSDLLRVMHLSKSSLYQAFGDKQTLFRRCLDRYRGHLTGMLIEQLAAAPSGRQFLADLLFGIAAEAGGSRQPGCLLMNSAIEFGQGNRKVAAWIKEGIDSVSAVFVAAVERGQREDDITRSIDAAALSRYLLVGIAGLRTLLKAGIDEESARATVRIILKSLD